jgi:hypothetical protein
MSYIISRQKAKREDKIKNVKCKKEEKPIL